MLISRRTYDDNGHTCLALVIRLPFLISLFRPVLLLHYAYPPVRPDAPAASNEKAVLR